MSGLTVEDFKKGVSFYIEIFVDEDTHCKELNLFCKNLPYEDAILTMDFPPSATCDLNSVMRELEEGLCDWLDAQGFSTSEFIVSALDQEGAFMLRLP